MDAYLHDIAVECHLRELARDRRIGTMVARCQRG